MTRTAIADPKRRSVYLITECAPLYGSVRPVQLVHCNIRPECAGCKVSAHGFICHFSDGTCVKLPFMKARV